VRLGTCIALELAVVAGALGGMYYGVRRAAEVASTYLVTPDAEAATTVATLPRAELPMRHTITIAPSDDVAVTTVFGRPDAELLAPIGASRITRAKMNRGGTSFSLRIDFESGARASFKPEQIHLQADPRREIAAYRMDRLLGIGHVPPVKQIVLPVADIVAAAAPGHRAYLAKRLEEEALARGGMLHGEASWWIPEIALARLGKQQIDEREGRVAWIKLLQVGATIPDQQRAMLEQIAAIVLFDVLIDNADRWSGNNTMMSPDGKLLYFMDNGMSFSIYKMGHQIPNAALRRIQVFPRGLVERIRTLTLEEVEAALAIDGETSLGRLLAPAEVSAILARRDNIMAYIDGLIAEHGEQAVLAFP
jgi:hypothetical protein